MKNLKLKLTIIGITLLSINAFAQDYVYQGVKNVDATIGMNNSESDSKQEAVSADCYDPANIGETIQAQGCEGLKIVDNNSLRQMVRDDGNYADTAIFTGQVTSMDYLFCDNQYVNYQCTLKQPIHSISNWNTENVKTMRGMFQDADNFNQSLNSWNTSSLTNTRKMFYRAISFNQPLNNWNTENLEKPFYMFLEASSFNQPLDKWNTSNFISTTSMFHNANSFNKNINSWDVSNVTNMYSMFLGATNFNQPLNNWNVSNVTDMNHMFYRANNFNQDISNWCVSNISNKPDFFDANSGFQNKTHLQPNWGCN